VICLFPTCKDLDEIQHIINSARYYPSLMSSISYGGLKYLAEFKTLKQSLPLVGDIKCCNIHINCQNLAVARNNLLQKSKNEQQQQQQHSSSTNSSQNSTTTSNPALSNHQRSSSISSLIDNINLAASCSQSSAALNWLSDKELGAGCLNRFGASIISMILNLFETRKITKVYGSLKTFIEELEYLDLESGGGGGGGLETTKSKTPPHFRKITADDFCTFQLNLEPDSILVNVSINSLAQTKYSQEICLCGSKGVLTWNNTKVLFRSTSKSRVVKIQEQQRQNLTSHKYSSDLHTDKNNNSLDATVNFSSIYHETEIFNEQAESAQAAAGAKSADIFLNSYKNIEERHPELPLLYIKGLFYYLENVKKEFIERSTSGQQKQQQPGKTAKAGLENFEHTRIVQSIVKNICTASVENRWITVNY
jgi:hypothetical protein